MPKARIMIVEDEAIVAADIEDCLKNLGYRVCGIAASGEGALAMAKELNPELVLMDIKLRGAMDGIEAAAAIRHTFDIPVIYLTAHADDSTLRRAMVTEPYGYIVKPFEETDLRIGLELALHKHRISRIVGTESRSEAAPEPKPNDEAPAVPETLPPPAQAEHEKKFSFLRRIEPFSKLSETGLHRLTAGCHLRRYSAGELIAFEHDENVEGFLVHSGRVAMLKTSASGRQLIVELLPPGDIFGLIVAIDKNSFPLTARTQTASEILWVPRTTMLEFLDANPDLYREFVHVISARLRSSYNLSRALAHDRVEIRVASALTALIPSFGSFDPGKESHRVVITRQELADLTGASVETAIRITKAMEREGVLDLSESGTIKIVDYQHLRGLLDE